MEGLFLILAIVFAVLLFKKNKTLKEVAKQSDDFKIKISNLEKDLEEKTNKNETLLQNLEDIKNYNEIISKVEDWKINLFKFENKFDTSIEYKEKINEIINKEKELLNKIKTDFRSNLDKKETAALFKLLYRCFNADCDEIIASVTAKNYDAQKSKLEKAYEQINKLIEIFNSKIDVKYLKLKQNELQLAVEYQYKIEAEKEEQRLIKEQMREEAKAQAEIEKVLKDAEKEQKTYEKALEKARQDLMLATEEQKLTYENTIAELEAKLKETLEKQQKAQSMAQQTKAGYVYVISNIGSFGEDVYKIGMTRRLEPIDRINELGDASVPFKFDVHAMIYSANAPELETQLHKVFDDKKVNKVNPRREFFRVTLDEIKKETEKVHGSEIHVTKIAEALEYRQSI